VAKKLTRHVKKLGDFKQLLEDIKAGVSGKQNLVFTFLPRAEDYAKDFETYGGKKDKTTHNSELDFYDEDRRQDVVSGRENF
jgi:hypothetical protein